MQDTYESLPGTLQSWPMWDSGHSHWPQRQTPPFTHGGVQRKAVRGKTRASKTNKFKFSMMYMYYIKTGKAKEKKIHFTHEEKTSKLVETNEKQQHFKNNIQSFNEILKLLHNN